MNGQLLGTLIAIGVGATACSKSTPTQPSDAGTTSSVTMPRPVAPAPNVLIRNVDQPVTLVVANAVVTQGSASTYTFEVATDTAFVNKVFSKAGVAAGANGQTSLTIDRIGPGAQHYWRAHAEGGGTADPPAPPASSPLDRTSPSARRGWTVRRRTPRPAHCRSSASRTPRISGRSERSSTSSKSRHRPVSRRSPSARRCRRDLAGPAISRRPSFPPK